MQIDYLVIGLGNAEEKYKGTRHNVGADFIERFLSEQGVELKEEKLASAKLAFLELEGKIVAFTVLNSYMNESGNALKKLMSYLSFEESEKLLIVYDEINIDFGDFKFSFGKSDGGHNGLKSVIAHLGTREFYRLRIGIGPQKGASRSDFVLKKFSLLERAKLTSLFDKLSLALLTFFQEGPEKAMNEFN